MTGEQTTGEPGRRVARALQGGGAHVAFAWGVPDRLLEAGLGAECETAALPADAALTSYDALAHLPISFEFNGEEAFLTTMFEAAGLRAGLSRNQSEHTFGS